MCMADTQAQTLLSGLLNVGWQDNHKIILDLCGGTGAWSQPYAEAGYDVRVITLPDYDISLKL